MPDTNVIPDTDEPSREVLQLGWQRERSLAQIAAEERDYHQFCLRAASERVAASAQLCARYLAILKLDIASGAYADVWPKAERAADRWQEAMLDLAKLERGEHPPGGCA